MEYLTLDTLIDRFPQAWDVLNWYGVPLDEETLHLTLEEVCDRWELEFVDVIDEIVGAEDPTDGGVGDFAVEPDDDHPTGGFDSEDYAA